MFGFKKKNLIQEPVYFLFTKTLRKDYEFKTTFPKTDDAEKIESLVGTVMSSYSFKKQEFEEHTDGDYTVYAWRFCDGRQDYTSRPIYTNVGFVIRNKLAQKESYNIRNMEREVQKAIKKILEEGLTAFDLECELPLEMDGTRTRDL